MEPLKTVEWNDGRVRMVDQTQLPGNLAYKDIENIKDMYHAIRSLTVRGAPAIGIAAAYGLCLGVGDFPENRTAADFLAYLEKHARYLAGARPTAVNLNWALDRLLSVAREKAESATVRELKSALVREADEVLREDLEMCRSIGRHGLELLRDHETLLTHCNAGGLATSGYGTALAPIYVGAEQGKQFHVYVDETRPLLQGARITAFELMHAGVAATLICDNMAASVMARRGIDAVIVGADRIAANGDTANKIGTYPLALVARAHSVPFYVAAPSSTFDLTLPSGESIPIEERDEEEITNGFGRRTAPAGVEVFNPAFDVTSHDLITALITEKGVMRPPFEQQIRLLMSPAVGATS